MDADKLIAFAALQGLFAITPGPAVLLVASHSARSGLEAGFRAALGVQLGNAVYLALSALGLSVALAGVPGLFFGVQLLGAAYLAWMGIKGLRASLTAKDGQGEMATAPHLTGSPFLQGAVKQLANPKSSLFFVALLPQFMSSLAAIAPQAVALALIATAVELPILCLYGALARLGAGYFTDPGRAIWRDRLSALALIVIAGWILAEALRMA